MPLRASVDIRIKVDGESALTDAVKSYPPIAKIDQSRPGPRLSGIKAVASLSGIGGAHLVYWVSGKRTLSLEDAKRVAQVVGFKLEVVNGVLRVERAGA